MNTIKRFDSFINEQKTTDILVNSGFKIVTDKKKADDIFEVMDSFDKGKIDPGPSPTFYVLNYGGSKSYSVIKGWKYVYVHEILDASADYYKAKSLEDALKWIENRQAYKELKYLEKPTNKKYLKGVVGANESRNI